MGRVRTRLAERRKLPPENVIKEPDVAVSSMLRVNAATGLDARK